MENEVFENRLKEVIPELYKADQIIKDNKQVCDSYKQEVKDIFEELDIQNYEVEDIKVSVQNIEKVTFDPLLIEYLKSHNLNNLVKTKEYVDEAEILMAVSKGNIQANDIEPFLNTKIEKRLTIKRRK